MSFDLDNAIEVLSRTPGTLTLWLGGLSDRWAKSNYGPDTFSPFDVVGHLIEAEKTNWMTRLRHILEHGDSKPFPPFDRYAMFEENANKDIVALLPAFTSLRAKSIEELKTLNMTAATFETRGHHPDLGEVTVANLISTWVVHDLGHLHQIAKAMAFQYRDQVGPWKKFLTILPQG